MTRKEFLQRQYELSVKAGTSQRYHQQCAEFWWYFDFGAKVLTALFAVIAFALAIVSALDENPAADAWGVAIAFAAAVAAVVLNVVPFGTWEQTHRDLFRQWTDFREDIDGIEYELGALEPSAPNICALSKLEARSHRIGGQEVSQCDARVKKCYDAEIKSRTPGSASIAAPQTVAV